jgi:hypothetical protein
MSALNLERLNQALFPDPNAPAKPLVARHSELLPAPVEPYSSIIETDCDDCAGTGAASGKREEYDPCGYCNGSGKQAVLRNWLVEAFQISAGRLKMNPRIEHLRALKHYATQILEAYVTPLAMPVGRASIDRDMPASEVA